MESKSLCATVNTKVAVFKLDTDDFEKYYNQRLIEKGCTVFPLSDFFRFDDRCQKNRLIIKKVLRLNLVKYDQIVVFDNYKIIPFIRLRMRANAKLILWNWNKQSIQIAQRERLVSPFCDIWTFDSNDAKKYNWKLNNQFYIPITSPNINASNSIRAFCTCLDKGRYSGMKKIRKQLMDNGVECDFTLVKDGTSNYDIQDSKWTREEGFPYSVFLQHTLDSDIIVDLVQPGQSGLTIRTLEALFYGKKIITNNLSVLMCPFYNEHNIFIMDNHNVGKLTDFLRYDFVEIKEENKIPYTYENWINQFSSK